MAKNLNPVDEMKFRCLNGKRAVYLEVVPYDDRVAREYRNTLIVYVQFFETRRLPNGQFQNIAIYSETAETALYWGFISEEDLYTSKKTLRWGLEIPEHFFEPFGDYNGCYVAYEDGLNGEKYPYIVVADKNVDPEMVYEMAKTMGAWEAGDDYFVSQETVLVQIPGYAPFHGKVEPMLFTMDGLKRALSK